MTTPPIQIWPIGDSLTAPYVSTLAADLASAGLSVELVGTQIAGAQHHEGHGGYRIGMIASNLSDYLAALKAQGKVPTTAIVVLGTNDLVSMPYPDIAKSIAQWKDLVAQLRAASVQTIVGATIPKTTIKNSPGVPLYNAQLRTAAASLHIPIVDLEKRLDPATLRDGVHFTTAGAIAMGHTIANVVIPTLKKTSSPSTSGNALAIAAAAIVAGLIVLRK